MNKDDYMWETVFLPRFQLLDDNRRQENIRELKTLVKDMHLAGYSASAIGRYTCRDHSTILYHLKSMDIQSGEVGRPLVRITKEEADVLSRQRTETLKLRLARIKENKKRIIEQKKLKEQIIRAKIEEKEVRSNAYKMERRQAEIMRAKVFKMYKAGATYHQIELKLKLPYNRIEGLLAYVPEYHVLKEKRLPKNSPKAVIQYDMFWNKIREFDTIREAGRHFGIPSNSIVMVCKERIPSAGGFKWKYKYHATSEEAKAA